MQLQSKVAVSPHSLQPHIDPHHTASEAYRVGGHVHPKAGALVSADHPSPTYSIPLTSLFPVQLSTSHQITSTLHNLLPHHIKTPSLPPSNQTRLFEPLYNPSYLKQTMSHSACPKCGAAISSGKSCGSCGAVCFCYLSPPRQK
jgi:hypothetical protein